MLWGSCSQARKEVYDATWQNGDELASPGWVGLACTSNIAKCPLGKVLTYKNLIYLLIFKFVQPCNNRYRFKI